MKFFVSFPLVVQLFLLTAKLFRTQDVPQITSNGTTIDVSDDDIAHFTCSARGQPTPLLSWQRSAGKRLTNSDKGVKILETNISQLISSHLFVAMTDSDRRGRYVCVASNKHGEMETAFIIKEGASSGLARTDFVAIGLALGLTVIIIGCMVYFLLVKINANKRCTQTTGPAEHLEAHSNPVAEESQDNQDFVTAL